MGFCFSDCLIEERGLVQTGHRVKEIVELLLAGSLTTQSHCSLSVGYLDTARDVLISCSVSRI